MKKLIILLLIGGMIIFTGCSKTNSSDTELQILGVDTSKIEKLEVIHGNIIVYPDFEQKDNLTLIEDLNTVLENSGDRIETIDENLGIALVNAEAYAQNDAENYYVFINFLDPQTINFDNNRDEKHQNCDGVLLDINNMKLYWSREGNLTGTMAYTSNLASVEREFSTFHSKLENIFTDLDN